LYKNTIIFFSIFENYNIRFKKEGNAMDSRIFDYSCLVLVLIGAINWGLVGFFKFDLVEAIFGNMTIISRIIYALVGIAGIYLLSLFGRIRGFGNN
jgi:uncharacterized membrane protein YuzA (DUF378 family)